MRRLLRIIRSEGPVACCLMMIGIPAAHAQCYVFSSGNQASLKVNLPNLPQPTTDASGAHKYTLTPANTAGDIATVTLGQTSYTYLPVPPERNLDAASSVGAISYGYIPLSASISTTEFGITLTNNGVPPGLVTVVLSGLGDLLPNGLPASFPPISAWNLTPRFIQIGSQNFPIDGINNCVDGGTAPPSIKSGGVVSASSFGQFTSIAPGSWIEIYGSNLASTTRSWTGTDFSGVNAPSSLDGTKVTIGGQAAFIDYVSPGQVNAQAPSNVATGSQQIVVTTPSGSSAPYTVIMNATQPGLLAPSSFKIGNTQYAAALFADGKTFVLPPGAIPGLASRRAQPGDTITLYGIGFGGVVPNIPAGQIVGQSNTLASNLQINVGTTPGLLTYSGLAPSNVGLYQFNVVVPNISSSDAVPVTFSLGGVPGTQMLFIAVQ